MISSEEVERRDYQKAEPQDDQRANVEPHEEWVRFRAGAGTVSALNNARAEYLSRIEQSKQPSDPE